MDDLEVSSSRLAWSWVIKVLATHFNVDLHYLQDLIQCIPDFSDNLNEEFPDNPYKQAREVIALRILESLFDPAMISISGVPLPSDQEVIQFDSSESPSHVFKRVMDLASMSSLRKDGDHPLPNVRKCSSDKLVREVHSYIERKKASLPESSVQELSDIIQKRDACHKTDLKWKRSCLKTQELRQNSTLEAQSGESPPRMKLIYDYVSASAEKSTAPLISSGMQDYPIDDRSGMFLSGKKHKDSGNGTVPCTLKLASSISSDMQDCPVDDECDLFPPGKNIRHDSNRSSLSEKTSAQKICPVDGQSGNSPPEKQIHDSIGSVASTEKYSDPLISSDINQPFPPSPKHAQPTGLLTCWPSDVLNEIEKRNAENSSTPPDDTELDICNKSDCPVDDQSDNFLSGKKRRDSGSCSVPFTELNLASSISSDIQDCPGDAECGLSPPGKKLRHVSNISFFSEKNSAEKNCPVDRGSGNSPPEKKSHDSIGSAASTEKYSDPLISSDINQTFPLSPKLAQPTGLLTCWPSDVLTEIKKRNAENSSTPATELDIRIKSHNDGDYPVGDRIDNILSGKKRRGSGNGSVPCTELKLASSISSDMQDCPVDVECGLFPPGKKLRYNSNGSSFSEKKSAEKNCPVDGQSGNSPLEKQSHDSIGSVAATEKSSDPLISSDINQPFPPSSKPAQPTGQLTCWPSDVLSETEKRNAENSSTLPEVTELAICIKCHKDGDVLFCGGTSCPVVVHEKCLGITESIDNRDNFLCPFCVCSLAKCKYTEAKERMLVARDKLTLFVSMNPDNKPKEFMEEDANPSRQGRVDGAFKGKGIYRVDQASADKQQDTHLARDNVHSSTPECLSKQAEGITYNYRRDNRQFTNVNPSSSRKGRDERKFKGKRVNLVGQAHADKQQEGHIEQDTVHPSPLKSIPANSCQTEKGFVLVNAFPPTDEQKNEHLAPDIVHSSTDKQASTDEKGIGVHQAHQASKYDQHNSHLAQDSLLDSSPNCFLKEGEDRTEKTCQLGKGDQAIPIENFHYAGVSAQQRLDHRLSKKASYSSPGNLVITPGRSCRAKISDNFLSPQSKRRLADLQGASTATLDDCDVISEEETSAATTSRLPKSFKNVETILSRPNRVPWTEKEVEMLKEGVKRFGSGNLGVIPWSMILEFGTGVFWKGRTGVNLKDKWRNLLKANPELR